MPEASEDEWARRFWKRNKTIEATKAKQVYSEWAEKRQRGAPDAGSPAPGLQRRGPRTPDPTDQTVSKRVWEKQIKSWRDELRLRSSSRRGQGSNKGDVIDLLGTVAAASNREHLDWDAAGDGGHPDHDSNGGESIDPPASETAEA